MPPECTTPGCSKAACAEALSNKQWSVWMPYCDPCQQRLFSAGHLVRKLQPPKMDLSRVIEIPTGLRYSERKLWQECPEARKVLGRLARLREAQRTWVVADAHARTPLGAVLMGAVLASVAWVGVLSAGGAL